MKLAPKHLALLELAHSESYSLLHLCRPVCGVFGEHMSKSNLTASNAAKTVSLFVCLLQQRYAWLLWRQLL